MSHLYHNPELNVHPPPRNRIESSVRTRTFYNTEYLQSRRAQHFEGNRTSRQTATMAWSGIPCYPLFPYYNYEAAYNSMNLHMQYQIPNTQHATVYGNTYQNLWMYHRSYDIDPLGHVSEWDEYLPDTPIRMAPPDPSWTPQKSRTKEISHNALKLILIGPPDEVDMFARELQRYYGTCHLNIEEIMKQDHNRFFVIENMRRRGLPLDLYGSDLISRQIDNPYVKENGYVLANFPRTVVQAHALEVNLNQIGMGADVIIRIKPQSGGQYFKEYKLFDERATSQIFDIDNSITPPQDSIPDILGFYTQLRSKPIIEADSNIPFHEAVTILHRRLAQFYLSRRPAGFPDNYQTPMAIPPNRSAPAQSNGFY